LPRDAAFLLAHSSGLLLPEEPSEQAAAAPWRGERGQGRARLHERVLISGRGELAWCGGLDDDDDLRLRWPALAGRDEIPRLGAAPRRLGREHPVPAAVVATPPVAVMGVTRPVDLAAAVAEAHFVHGRAPRVRDGS